MASIHECIECGEIVTTESTVAGPFEAPPTIKHAHEDGTEYDMDVVGYTDSRAGVLEGDA